ncbi:MAG: hypothetical protein ACAI43_19470 [Phycisphaerae bacterium]|nr:hypothetical protein [Tepidisphaeraceae bacterium]
MAQYTHGHWMAVEFFMDGSRTEHELILGPGSTFRWAQSGRRGDRTFSGTWSQDAENTITFVPTKGDFDPNDLRWDAENWRDSNCVLSLRWAGLASRNLPIFFYRVHPVGCDCGGHPWSPSVPDSD